MTTRSLTAIAAMNAGSRTFASGTMSYANPLAVHDSVLSEIRRFYHLDLIAAEANIRYKGFTAASCLSHYHRDLLGKDPAMKGKNEYLPLRFDGDTTLYSSALATSMAKCAFGKMTLERASKGVD